MTIPSHSDVKVDLLPCPFCGGPARLVEINLSLAEWQDAYVECNSDCGAVGEKVSCFPDDYETPHTLGYQHAIAAWNRRSALTVSEAPAAEPVAWIVGRPVRDGHTMMCLPLLRGREEMERYQRNNPDETLIPLYSSPPSSVEGALREALRPFAELGEVVLAEAPPDAVAAWSFRGTEGHHLITLDTFRRAIAALSATPSAEQGGETPEGFVLVPKEPTEAMIEAAEQAHEDAPLSDWGKFVGASDADKYRAMLAASPNGVTDHG